MYKKKDGKTPSDYETLRVRIPSDFDVTDLMNRVELVREHLNKNKPPDRKMWMGNHVILQAIDIGLKDLKKKRG